MSNSTDISKDELRDRVIYALLLPASRMARVFGLSLRDLSGWLEMAYFHELRDHGAKMKDVAEHMQISMRKAAQLSARLKTNFLDSEREVGLPRRIEFVLWAEPLSAARLKQVLVEEDPDAIDEAIAALLQQGRIREIAGRQTLYEVTKSEFRLVHDTWISRVDALTNLAGTVAHAAFGRFFANEKRALARTLSFRVAPEELDELRRLYEEHIFPTLRDLDERAKDRDDAEQIDLSLCWAPYEYLNQPPTEGDDQ